MWIFIIIIIFVFIIWGNNKHQNINEKIRKNNNNVGGFRSNFPNLVNILENELGMVLKYDDGRSFCYKKVEDSEELTIGLKLDTKNYKIMFSELEKNGKKETGRDVPFISDNDNIPLEVTIKLCTENLNTSINKNNYKKNI